MKGEITSVGGMEITEELKTELLEFVLSRTSVSDFNIATRQFNVQILYSRLKRELKKSYPELMPGDLYYSLVMAEVFRPYRCDEIKCKDNDFKLDVMMRYYKALPKHSQSKRDAREAYNELVSEQNLLLKPQMDLIALYRRLKRVKNK